MFFFSALIIKLNKFKATQIGNGTSLSTRLVAKMEKKYIKEERGDEYTSTGESSRDGEKIVNEYRMVIWRHNQRSYGIWRRV